MGVPWNGWFIMENRGLTMKNGGLSWETDEMDGL